MYIRRPDLWEYQLVRTGCLQQDGRLLIDAGTTKFLHVDPELRLAYGTSKYGGGFLVVCGLEDTFMDNAQKYPSTREPLRHFEEVHAIATSANGHFVLVLESIYSRIYIFQWDLIPGKDSRLQPLTVLDSFSLTPYAMAVDSKNNVYVAEFGKTGLQHTTIKYTTFDGRIVDCYASALSHSGTTTVKTKSA